MILPILVSAIVSLSSPDSSKLDLKNQLSHELSSVKGTFALAFKDLQTGEEILINERENFHAASTMKTPVLIEAYKQAAQGRFSLDDSVTVHQNFKSIADGSEYILDQSSDSDQDIYKEMGKKLSINNLLYRMVIHSSNLATNMMIEMVGAKAVTETMREIGAKDIKVLRGVEDSKAYERGLNNSTTAYDQLLIYSRLGKGKLINPEASQAMIKILLDQEFNDIIPARLPKEVKVAHKTGFISGIQHDAGIVYLPDGRKYVLILLSKDLEDEKKGIEVMAGVSEKIYKYVAGR